MTLFYLGTHRPSHATNGQAKGPLFISVSTLRKRKSLYPKATVPWALDSSGFSELTLRGGWTFDASEYVKIVDRLIVGLGFPDFAAIQDYMCEDVALRKTGLTVEEHQRRTVRSFLDLRSLRPNFPWLPTIQGRTVGDYYRCVELYAKHGVNLTTYSRVGLGSVCRRQATTEIVALIQDLSQTLKLHGFGVKLQGLEAGAKGKLVSSDSLAWSYATRRRAAYPPIAANAQCVAEAYREIVHAALHSTNEYEKVAAQDYFSELLRTVGVKQ